MSTKKIVQSIIEAKLLNSDRVSKYFVIEEIRNKVNLIELFNKALTNKVGRSDSVTDDGIKNTLIGAQKFYREGMRSLRESYVEDEEGWISKRIEQDPPSSRKNIKLHEYRDELLTLPEIAKREDVKYETLRSRVIKNKWSIENAVSQPLIKQNNSEIILSLIPDNSSIEREKLLNDFSEYIDEIRAISSYKIRQDSIKKTYDHDLIDQIKIGKERIFTIALSYLKRNNVIQVVKKNKIKFISK